MIENSKIITKKQSKNKKFFKSDEDLKTHFIERLNERYNIVLTDDEYVDIHNIDGFQNSKTIQDKVIPWAKISSKNSAYIIKLKGKLVLAIYSKRRGRFITALPWNSYNDETRFVPQSLKKLNLKEESIKKYNEILSICAKEYQDFGNVKNNWHYYQKCTYSNLLMLEFKGYLTIGKIYEQVLEEFKKHKTI